MICCYRLNLQSLLHTKDDFNAQCDRLAADFVDFSSKLDSLQSQMDMAPADDEEFDQYRQELADLKRRLSVAKDSGAEVMAKFEEATDPVLNRLK